LPLGDSALNTKTCVSTEPSPTMIGVLRNANTPVFGLVACRWNESGGW
jgi:hypothetical protein